MAPAKAWLPSEKLFREFQSIGFYLSAHPLDEYDEVLQKRRVQKWSDFQRAVKAGSTAGRLAGTVTSKQERKTRTGNRMGIIQLSDSTGQFEVVVFSEGLAQYREMLEAGNSVVMLVEAEDKPEGISLRLQSARNLEQEASQVENHLRIFLRDETPLASIPSLLQTRGEGTASIVVLHETGEREVEINIPGRRSVSPQVRNAIKGVPGVVDAELV